MLLALIWKFDFPPFMVLIIAILNDGTFLPLCLGSEEVEVETRKGCNAIWLFGVWLGTIMTISKDRVKPSPLPDSWKLAEIFTTGVVLGGYQAMMTVIFFWAAYKTDFFPVRIIVNLSWLNLSWNLFSTLGLASMLLRAFTYFFYYCY